MMPGGWSPMTDVLTSDELNQDNSNPCPNCGHPLNEHLYELGCDRGWDSPVDGCACPLTLAGQHDPPHEGADIMRP